MRVATSLFALLLIAACGGGEEAAPAADQDETMEAAAPTVADFAGTWQTTAMLEGVEDPVPTVLQGSADGSDWTMTLPGRDPLAVTVSMSGDSLIIQTEEYESILREGVMVSVRTAGVMQDGTMVGKMLAVYDTPDGEERVPGTIQGTREGGM